MTDRHETIYVHLNSMYLLKTNYSQIKNCNTIIYLYKHIVGKSLILYDKSKKSINGSFKFPNNQFSTWLVLLVIDHNVHQILNGESTYFFHK